MGRAIEPALFLDFSGRIRVSCAWNAQAVADTIRSMTDFISKRTRREFREYFVGTSLRIIGDTFDAEDVVCDRGYSPPEGGQRRSYVEQYYHSVDWRNPSDVGRVLLPQGPQ